MIEVGVILKHSRPHKRVHGSKCSQSLKKSDAASPCILVDLTDGTAVCNCPRGGIKRRCKLRCENGLW